VTNLLVFTYVVSERNEAGFELLRLQFHVTRLVEVKERPAELFHLLVADAFRVTRQNLPRHVSMNSKFIPLQIITSY